MKISVNLSVLLLVFVLISLWLKFEVSISNDKVEPRIENTVVE